MDSRTELAPKVVRVGLLGCGKMGIQHLKVLATIPNVKVVGVADPALAGEDVAGLLPPDALVTKDAASLFETARPDVVHIVTPPATHASLAMAALRAGCHILVEKPFTIKNLAAKVREALELV